MARTRIDTHSGTPSSIRLFGLEGKLYLPAVLALLLSIILFALVSGHSVVPGGLAARFIVASLPFGLTLAYLLIFVQGRPPHFFFDTLVFLMEGPHFNRNQIQRRSFYQWRHPILNPEDKSSQ